MNFTPQQQAFITAFVKETHPVLLEARAGTGKTFCLVEAAKAQKYTMDLLCVAFAKRNAVDLEERMPHWVEAATLNAIGHRAWAKQVGRRLRVDTRKTWNIARELKIKKFPDLARAIGLIKANAIGPEELTAERLADICDNAVLDFGECNPGEVLMEVMSKSIELAHQGAIDFDDQLYMSVLFKAPFVQRDAVMVDEAQDLSPIQHGMLKRILRKDGRLIAVGDPFQAIYGFRGASTDSIGRLTNLYDLKCLPLTVSFRCDQAIIAEAQKLVPDITAREDAADGLVKNLGGDWKPNVFIRGDTILCRNTKPLVQLCWALLKEGVGATVLGREIGLSLVKVLDKGRVNGTFKIALMDTWANERYEALLKSNKVAQADFHHDKVEAARFMFEEAGTYEKARVMIEKMFSDKAGIITLSTVHKAKGMEWDRVFILDRHLMPSKWAKTEDDRAQERNIEYVAVTRAKHELYFINSSKETQPMH